jgi:hypothetical protein
VITRQALEALEVQIQARVSAGGSGSSSARGDRSDGGSVAAASTDAPPPPSTVKFAAGVVKGVIVEMVPPQHRKKAGVLGIVLAVLAIVFGVRGLRARRIARRWRSEVEDEDYGAEFGSNPHRGRDR